MKKNKSLLIGLTILLAGMVGIYLLFSRPPVEPVEPAGPVESIPSATQAGQAGEPEIETVVPVHAGKIVRTTLHEYEVVQGQVEAVPPGTDSPGRTMVRAAVDGVLAQVSCRPGQTVEAGDELFWIDERVAKQTVEEQQQNLEFAQQEFARQEQLLDVQETSTREFQQAERTLQKAEQVLEVARVALDYYSVRAPVGGTVASVNVAVGEPVQSVQVLAEIEITDPRRQIVSLQIPAAVASRIQSGQAVQILDGEEWQPAGLVDYVAEGIDPQNGTVEIHAALPASTTLRAGQLVKARIDLATHADCLAVPASALVEDPEHGTFIAIISDDQAQLRPVARKLRDGDLVEIEGEGLAEGMAIVTEGAFGLPAKTRIKVIDGP